MKSYAATAAAAMSAIIVSTAVFGARFQPEYIDYGDYSSGSSLTRSSLSFLYEYVNALQNYCRQDQCPPWACQDDSIVIHGFCCGCEHPMRDLVPVPCSENLLCPIDPTKLCAKFEFTLTCCCKVQPQYLM